MSPGVVSSSELQLKPSSQEIPRGFGDFYWVGVFLHAPQPTSRSSETIRYVYGKQFGAAIGVTGESLWFTYWGCASNVLCCEGFPLSLLLKFSLGLRTLHESIIEIYPFKWKLQKINYFWEKLIPNHMVTLSVSSGVRVLVSVPTAHKSLSALRLRGLIREMGTAVTYSAWGS